MEKQWEVTSTNRQSSNQDSTGQSGIHTRRGRLDSARPRHTSISNKTSKSEGSSEVSGSVRNRANVGSGNTSPIKFARSVVESTRSKVTAQQKKTLANDSCAVDCENPIVPESPDKFVPSVCERTRSRSRSLTPGSDFKLNTSSSLFRRQCDSRASTPNSVDSRTTYSDISSVESKATNSRNCSPSVTQDSTQRKQPQKISVVRTPIKVKVKPQLSGSEDSPQIRKISVFPKQKTAVDEKQEEFAEASVFKNVDEALKSLSTETKSLVPLVCLHDYQLTGNKDHVKDTPSHVKALKTPIIWNPDILERIRKVGRLLKSKENIEEDSGLQGTLNKSDVDSMDLSVIDEVASYGARCDDSEVKETVTNGIDKGKGVTKSPRKGAKRVASENVESPAKRTPKKSPRKSPKKAAAKNTPTLVIPKVGKETEFPTTPLTIDVPGESASAENPHSLSAGKDAEMLRQGRRIRSPSIRYADDMILFPLKSPRRSRSPKGDGTSASPEDKVDDSDSHSSVCSEKTVKTSSAQTSQLYSLLTGSVTEAKGKDIEEDKKVESPVIKRSPRGRKKMDTSVQDSCEKSTSGRKGRGRGAKKEQENENSNATQKDGDEKLKAVRELNFDSVKQKSESSYSNLKEKKKENKEDSKLQVKEKSGPAKEKEDSQAKTQGKKSSETAPVVKKSQGRGRKKTKQAEKSEMESDIGNIDKVLSLVKLEINDPEQGENYEKYTAVNRKSQGLFDLISKVKNNIDYEKIFPGVIADAPLYALDDEDDIEEKEEVKESNKEKDASKSSDIRIEDKECDSKKETSEVQNIDSEASSKKSVEFDENGQEEIVDDFFSEDFLQMKKSPKKKTESGPQKDDSILNDVTASTSKEAVSEMKVSLNEKDVNSDGKTLDSPVRNVESRCKSENSIQKTLSVTPMKSKPLTPQEESRIPISPADVILVDQATSSTTNGKTLFERFKEQKPSEEDSSGVDSTSGKEDAKMSTSSDDKMGLLTIDVQERRNIFDTIMREYSPREKDKKDDGTTKSPKKNDEDENKDVKSGSALKNAEIDNSQSPEKIIENSKSSEKEVESFKSPDKKVESEGLQSPVKQIQGEKSQIHAAESTKTPEKSIVEKIQEKLGLDLEDSHKKSEKPDDNVVEENDVAQKEETLKETEEILEDSKKESEVNGEEVNAAPSLNVSKDSSEFEICMDTVDDQQPLFSDGNEKSETSSVELNDGQPNATVSEFEKKDEDVYVPTKHVPKASFGKIIKEPAPLSVLQTVETLEEKPNVFESEKLNEFLLDRCNRHVLIGKSKNLLLMESPTKSGPSEQVSPEIKESPSEVNLVGEDMDLSEIKDDGDEIEELHDEEDDDEMHAGSERGENIPRLTSLVEECDPDFDEIDGVLFISFPNEESLNAHLKVEQKSKIGKSEKILLGMARMKNIRQRQKQIRQTAHKKAWARMKSLKAQFKIDQSLQGMHLVLAKYQRIYKRELVLNLLAKEEEQSQDGVLKQPQKTSDVTKIKGWKNKFGENGGDSSKSLKQKGKLHWKTEESLLKSLHPDELREYGFDLKKKRRKNLIFTIRKGMSKGDGPGSKTEKVAESLDGGVSSQENSIFIHDGLDTDEHYDGEVMNEEYVVYDMERQKMLEKKVRDREKKYLMKKLKMDNTDIDILRKLGGQRIGRPIKIPKSHEENLDDGEATKEPESESKQEVDDDVTKEEAEPGADGVVKKKRRKRRKNTFMIITLNTALANFALTALDKKFVPKKKKSPKKVVPSEGKKEGDEKIVDQSDEKKEDAGSHDLSQNPPEVKTEPRDEVGQDSDVPRPDSRNSISRPESRESHCDSSNMDDHTRPDSTGSHDNEDSKDKSCGKLGCRYGCICHLCQSWDTPSPEEPTPNSGDATCNKEYCKLGCICDSTEIGPKEHCGKPECMFECLCLPKRKAAIQGQKLISMEMEKSTRGRGMRGKRGRKRLHELHQPYEDVLGEVGVNDPEYYPGGCKSNTRRYAGARGKRGAGNQRYATLPKRETTYRLAKNLDAVSRKAMLVYETSEMYADHKGKTRKRQDCIDGQPVVSKHGTTVQSEGIAPHRPLLIAPKPQTMSGIVPSHIVQKHQMMKSNIDHSMDYDLSLFDSESDGEDSVDLYSCARHLPYNTNNRRPTRKCTCGVNHDLVCKSAESLVTMNKQSQPKGADGKAKTPGAGKAASNLPKPPDHFPMPGWHTQWVCLKSNKEPAKSENNGIKLLEIMSNCNWEPHKQKLLSKISIMLQNGGYPKPRKKLVGEYYIEFLPKSEKPAVIPMEVRKNIPDTIYAVRTRIYKKLDSQYMNELIKEQEKILESRVPAITEASKTGAQTINSSVTSYAAQSGFDSKISGKQSNEKSQQIPKVKVQGGISGLSQLQYSQQVSPASDAKIMQSNTCMSHTTTTSFVYSTPKTSINLNSSSSTAKSAGFVSLTSTTRVGAVVPQSSASIDNVTESTQVSTMVTSSMNPVSAQQANTSSKSTSSVTVSSNSAVSKVSLSITQPSKTNNVHAKEIISQLEKPPLSTVCTSALFNVSSEVSKSVVSSVISSIHQSISTSQPLVTKKTVHVPIDTSVRTVPRVAILSSKSSTHSSVQSLGKKAEYIGSFKGKLVTGTAVAQLVTPITVSGIDVTSTSLTSTTTTDSLPSKPKTNATPTSTEKPKASTPCILDANKYSPLKLNPDLLKPLDSMKASKPSILDASKFSPLKLSSLKTSDTQVSTSEKLCAIGSKTTPVTLLGPFDSPSKIPKVLPHMKVLQAKSISKDGKPVIHLIPYTTPMSGASLASNIMSVPITLSSITSVSDPKGVKIPAAHEVKPDVLPVMPRVDQPDLTTGCMFTVSNPVATTTSASTSVPMETSVGSSVTSPIESEHIMPSHGDQIILLSSGEANDKIMEKLQSASKLDTEAVLTASEDCRRKGGDYSIRNEACDNEEEDSQGTKENQVEKEDDVEEKSALKRKPVEDDDSVKSKDVKKRKMTSDEDGASMLAKILASTDAEQAYVQSRGVGVTAQTDRIEGDGTEGLGASDMNDTTDGQNASKSVRESENESDEEVALRLDLSDDTDETVAGGLMESDLSNQSLEEKKGQGQGDREVSEEKVEGGNSQEVHSQEVHPQEVHSQETEPPVEEEETEENKEEPKIVEEEKKETVDTKSEISEEENQQSTTPCSLLALELTKGPSASNNTESGDSNSAESETANSEISKKRKPEDESEEGLIDAMPKTKRLKSGSEEKGEGSDITGAESGVTERDTEDWDSQMCMVEDTDDMTVVIPSDDETDAPQPRSNQDVDCVVLDSSDEEIDVEEDSGIDAVHLLRKQAAIMKECYKVTCNVHRVGKLDFKTKRKSTHDANVIMDEKPEFREGVVMASSSKSATYKKVKSEEKSKAQIKRREEMRDSFVYLAEAMYGTNQSREHIMKTLCGNEQKLGLMKKATFVIKSLAEFDKKFNQGFREMSVKNNMLKEKLNSLKNFMIRERGMPWMVLQAHLDKISKVCTKIIQNMPAILKTRAAGAPIRMLRPGVTVMGIRGHPGGRPSLQVRQAGPRPAGLRLLSSTFPSFPHTKIGINQNTGIRQANASAGSASSQVKPSKDVKESAKEKDYAGERKKTQKVGSAKRKPSHTSPAVYIDYAEDEAEVYEDLMGGKSDFGDHFGDHVLDLTSDGEDSTLAVSKAGDGKMPNKTDDRSKIKSDKTTFKTDSQVATYHIETSNSTVGSALINASDSLSTNVLNQSSVVEVSMSDFGKVAKLQNGHPADSLSTPISHSVSDSDKFLVNSNNSNSTSLDLGSVKSEPNS